MASNASGELQADPLPKSSPPPLSPPQSWLMVATVCVQSTGRWRGRQGGLEIQMLKLIPRRAETQGGRPGSWFLLQESQLFLARRLELRNAAACVAWRMGPLRANRPHPTCRELRRLPPQRPHWVDPQGPSFIFLMLQTSILEAKTG